jgi:hypothetical protein
LDRQGHHVDFLEDLHEIWSLSADGGEHYETEYNKGYPYVPLELEKVFAADQDHIYQVFFGMYTHAHTTEFDAANQGAQAEADVDIIFPNVAWFFYPGDLYNQLQSG